MRAGVVGEQERVARQRDTGLGVVDPSVRAHVERVGVFGVDRGDVRSFGVLGSRRYFADLERFPAVVRTQQQPDVARPEASDINAIRIARRHVDRKRKLERGRQRDAKRLPVATAVVGAVQPIGRHLTVVDRSHDRDCVVLVLSLERKVGYNLGFALPKRGFEIASGSVRAAQAAVKAGDQCAVCGERDGWICLATKLGKGILTNVIPARAAVVRHQQAVCGRQHQVTRIRRIFEQALTTRKAAVGARQRRDSKQRERNS